MYCVGLDIADVTLTCSCVTPAFDPARGVVDYRLLWFGVTLDQSPDGWNALLALLAQQQIAPAACKIVMEATGVYSERVSYYFYERGWAVFVEPPLKVRRAFYERGKTDPLDSRQIAEYGLRFGDKLHPWRPKAACSELIATLLTTREQLVKMRTACKNIRRSLARKQTCPPAVSLLYDDLVDDLKRRLAAVETTMEQHIAADPFLAHTTAHLLAIKSLGRVLIWHFLVVTEGYTTHLRHQDLAAYIGICPFEYRSGTSVYRRPHADGAGPSRLRKQLYLAAMRLRQHHPAFRQYFERKVKEGKSPRLVLTNLENRALKLMCGVVKSGKPYLETYQSLK